MFKPIDPFLAFCPELDLHGYTRDIAPILVDDFIRINHKMGKKKLIVIHGRSGGVLKEAVHSTCKKNKLVKKYYLNSSNIGCTIIELK